MASKSRIDKGELESALSSGGKITYTRNYDISPNFLDYLGPPHVIDINKSVGSSITNMGMDSNYDLGNTKINVRISRYLKWKAHESGDKSKRIYFVNIYLTEGTAVLSNIGVFESKNIQELTDLSESKISEEIAKPGNTACVGTKNIANIKIKPLIFDTYIFELIQKQEKKNSNPPPEEKEKLGPEDGSTTSPSSASSTSSTSSSSSSESFSSSSSSSSHIGEKKGSVEIKDIRGSHSDWIDKFMEDSMFGVTETIADGSCFFDAIRIALKSAGINKTIPELRSLIAESPEIVDYYNNRLGIFGPAVLELVNQWNNGENVKGTIAYILSLYRSKELPIFFSATFNGLQQILEMLDGEGEHQIPNKNYVDLKNIIKRNFSMSKFDESDAVLLSDGIQFLVNLAKEEAEAAYANATPKEKENKEVSRFPKMDILANNLISNEDPEHREESLENYKNFIKEPDFWAEGASIIIFEKALNIKVIIVSEEGTIAAIETARSKRTKIPSYEDYSAVMCQGPDTTNPDYYIIVTKSVNHYRLITYNGKGIFKRFNDLPKKIKDMIVTLNCPEYNDIIEVKEYKARRGGTRRMNKGKHNKKSRRRRH